MEKKILYFNAGIYSIGANQFKYIYFNFMSFLSFKYDLDTMLGFEKFYNYHRCPIPVSLLVVGDIMEDKQGGRGHWADYNTSPQNFI